MASIQRAIFPAILFCSILLILLTRGLASPQANVQAAVGGVAQPAPILEGFVDLLLYTPPTPAPTEIVTLENSTVDTPHAVNDASESSEGCQVSPAYPASILQWCETITQQAAQHGLDPNLIAAVMLQESGGDAGAYSSSGAVGLMQVMPRDGLAANFQCKNGPCFASRPSMDELYDPNFNIEYGARMLSGLISRTGDVREALRAYGPMDMGYHYADLVLSIYQNYR